MNKNYTSIITLFTILFFGALSAQETQKNFINYQGVARNAGNELMADESMNITIGVKFGAANASAVYEENHNIDTDANGVFSLLIGNGSTITGNYNTLPWGSAATFVTVSMNGTEIGTTEMMAVPYAISAGSMEDPSATEVLYDNSASGLVATTAQEAIDELVTGGSVDADADPSNEFQMLSFDAGTNELSLSDGNAVTIPSGGTDADADPTNEIQTISFDVASNKISLTDGGEITIPSGGTDADADPSNEFQTLSFDAGTNELSLSDGNSVTIPSGSTDADADPTNELQDISLSGTELTITDGSTIDFAPIIPPGGTDNQELTFNETTKMLEIEDGNTVDLSSLSGGSGSSLWTADGSNINYTSGRVGIGSGSESSNATLEVAGAANSEGILNVKDTEIVGRNLAISGFGLQGRFDGANSSLSLNKNGGNIYLGSDVGIGLTGLDSPEATLDVDGNIRSRDLSGGGNVVADVDGNLVIGSGGGGSLWAEDDEGVYQNDGNVGIGTTPSSQRSLNISTTDEIIRDGIYSRISHAGYKSAVTARAEGNDDSNTFGIRSDARGESTGPAWAYRGDIGGAGTGIKYGLDLIFYDGTAGTKYGVYTKGENKNYFSGDMGIGIQDPTAKMHVLHDSGLSSPQLRLEESAEDYARLEFKNNNTGYWHIAGRGGSTGDVSRLNFYHHNGTVGRDFMTIAGSGNVGIRTTEPTAKLDVNGDLRIRDLSGAGQRNVVADASGNLIIGSGGGSRKSNYFQEVNLGDIVNATATFQPIGPSLSIDKEFADSTIEVRLNSRAQVIERIAPGSPGARFKIRIDGQSADFGNDGSMRISNGTEFLSMFNVFLDLPVGHHTIQIFVQSVNAATPIEVRLDPGNWGGAIIAKETY